MSSERRVNPQDLFAEASKAADELYNIRETYFPPNPDDKTSKLNTDSTLALQLLDSIPPGITILNDFFDVNSIYVYRLFIY